MRREAQLQRDDDAKSPKIQDKTDLSVSTQEVIRSCIAESNNENLINADLSGLISDYLIQANGRKMPTSETLKLVDNLISKIA
jgi:hypothetical protein